MIKLTMTDGYEGMKDAWLSPDHISAVYDYDGDTTLKLTSGDLLFVIEGVDFVAGEIAKAKRDEASQ